MGSEKAEKMLINEIHEKSLPGISINELNSVTVRYSTIAMFMIFILTEACLKTESDS